MRFCLVNRLGKILPFGLLYACALITDVTPHPITLYSLDGEVLKGEYVFSSRMKGTVTVTKSPGGEVLTGEFTSVDNTTFSRGFIQNFGQSWNVTTGGQYQGMGIVSGGGTVIQCFYVGSMRTNHGFGKCKSSQGKEYDLQF